MEKSPSVNYTIALQFLPHRLWYAPGPGWAVTGAFLAAGLLQVQPDFLAANAPWLAKLGLLWLLADPVLGTVWHLLRDNRLWPVLQGRLLPEQEPVRPVAPYTAKNSAGYRAAVALARLREQGDGLGQSLLWLVLVSLVTAALLGRQAVVYVAFSLWAATRDTGGPSAKPRYVWQSIAQFALPFIVMLSLLQALTLPALLLGGAYWVVYLGSLRLTAGYAGADRLVVTGQGVAAILLFALAHPIAGAVVSLSTIFSLLFRWAAQQQKAAWPQTAAHWQLLLSTGYLAGALALGGWG